MEYREFMEQIKKDLPERLFGTLEGATVDTTQVDRLQGCSYEGLSIVPDGSMIGLTMDLQPYFQMFSNGISYENIVEQIADRAAGAYADRPAVTAEDFGSYEAVKDKLMIQLIGRKGNEEMLKTIPHHPIEDMEIVLTGRNAKKEVIDMAHLVSEIVPVKHYWDIGVSAREGMEY